MIKKLSYFNFKEKFGIIFYSLCSRIKNKISKGLKSDYEFIRNYYDKLDISICQGSFLIKNKLNNESTVIKIKRYTSDCKVYEQIIINTEYKAVLEVLKTNDVNLEIMIDAGANIGLTSIYFARHYPNCKVIALEPNSTVYSRCLENVNNNKIETINIINKGLWPTSTKLKADIDFRDGKDWSFRLVEADSIEDACFETLSPFEIFKTHNLKQIDFFKMDIEGGEKEVFSSEIDLSWLKKVKVIAIEIHSEFNCRIEIIKILLDFGFDLSESGELTIGVNKNLV